MSERPAIVSINESTSAGTAQVSITLSYQDAAYVGEASGKADLAARPRLVGEATLRSVEAVTDNKVQLSLEAIATTSLGPAQVAMAQVSIKGDESTLVGTAMLEETDRSAATVRAVLDAINRRLVAVL